LPPKHLSPNTPAWTGGRGGRGARTQARSPAPRTAACTPCSTRLALTRLCYIPLDWFGLGWVGLGWVGLGWVGLGWVGLGWVGLGWMSCDAMRPEEPARHRKTDARATPASHRCVIELFCWRTRLSYRAPASHRRNTGATGRARVTLNPRPYALKPRAVRPGEYPRGEGSGSRAR